MTQRVIYIKSNNFISPGQLETSVDWASLFGNARPIALEIGCGTGHFVVDRAQQQPDVNFVAIDIYNKGCWKTCKKTDALGLTNIRVARAEAAYLLEKAFNQTPLSAIYINCPDPWPKKRHRKRRLVNRDFLLKAWHHLTPGGDFFFSSDVSDYAHNVATLLEQNPAYRNCLDQPVVHHLPGYPISKYMQRFLDLGQPIHYLQFQRDPAKQSEIPTQSPATPRTGFRSRWARVHNE